MNMGKVKNIEWIDVGALVPYENNSKKHPPKQIEKIIDSIGRFGFLSPLLIDEQNRIIAGHGRLIASKQMHIGKVPCTRVDGLSDEERRAYIIADNRLTEMGGWDKEILAAELEALSIDDFDIELTGFDDMALPQLEETGGYYGDERERTNKAYNLDIANDTEMTDDFWQMPVIYHENVIPEKLVGFNYAKSAKEKSGFVHFFLDDYQFERIWNYPEKYTEILEGYDGILSPDFSLYKDMPMPMKIWNTYRSRQIGSYYQGCGLKVIPTVSWAERNTFEFCFKGIEEGSTVAVSTIGVKTSEEAKNIWLDGMAEMIRVIHPNTILLYGGDIDFEHDGIKVVSYKNDNTERMKN